jgi:hypothetical protein
MNLQLLHIILAITVYFSSIGYTLNRHFCKGELISSAIFLPATPCENASIDFDKLGLDPSKLQPCCIKALEEEHKSCCEDASELKKNDEKVKPFSDYLSLDVFATEFVFPFITLPGLIAAKVIIALQYRPPPLLFNFQTLFQVFRI